MGLNEKGFHEKEKKKPNVKQMAGEEKKGKKG